jgi:hypothetical protein
MDVFSLYFFRYGVDPSLNKYGLDPNIHSILCRNTMRSFRYHNPDALIVYHTNAPDLARDMDPIEVVEVEPPISHPWHYTMDLWEWCVTTFNESDRIVCVDMDMIFLDNPFREGNQCPFERINSVYPLGLSTRMIPYRHPSTVAFMAARPGKLVRSLFGERLKEWRKSPTGDHDVQDMEYAKYLLNSPDLPIVDLGFYWDYCPGIKDYLYRAVETRSVGAIHLKGEAKCLLNNKRFRNLPELNHA